MERTYSKLTEAYVMVSKSRDDTVLPKHEDILPLLGDTVQTSGGRLRLVQARKAFRRLS